MGNYVSCTLSSTSSTKKIIRVVFPKTGEVKTFSQTIKAAEIMLESPSHFLVNSLSLHHGRRFSALNADEDLEKGNVYIMFPMNRVNSVITTNDMAALFLMAKRDARDKVLPEPELEVVSPVKTLSLDDIDDISVAEFKQRLSLSRSKKPLLETIAEEPVCLRR